MSVGESIRHRYITSAVLAALAFSVMSAPPSGAAPVELAPEQLSFAAGWTLPAPTAAGTWRRPVGLYPSADSTHIYSGIAQEQFSGRYTCDSLISGAPAPVVDVIDTKTGNVVNKLATGFAPGSPLTRLVADTTGSRLLAFSGTCPNYYFSVIDTASGALVTTRSQPRTSLPYAMVMGPNPDEFYSVHPVGPPEAGWTFEVQATNALTGQTRWLTNIGTDPGMLFAGDQRRQYHAQRMAVSPDGSRLFVLNPGAAKLFTISVASGQILNTTQLTAGRDYRDLNISQLSPLAYVTNWNDNSIVVINTDSGSIVNTLKIPGRCPESVSIDAAGDLLAVHVACDEPRLLLMSTIDGSVQASTPATPDVSEIRLLPDASALISRRNTQIASNVITKTRPAATKANVVPIPQQPRRLSTQASGTSAVISWTKPVNATKAKVTGYRVTLKPTGERCITKAKKLSCTFTNLTPGKKYQFTVEARNAKSWGYKSVSSLVQIPIPPPAPAPAPAPPVEKPEPVLS